MVKITGIAKPGHTVSILMRGSNKLMLEEADRSLHDALCVIRCLVRKRYIIAGGGAPGKYFFMLKHRDLQARRENVLKIYIFFAYLSCIKNDFSSLFLKVTKVLPSFFRN